MKVNVLILSDNLEYIKSLPDNSIDSCITDSPYGLGKKQDLIKILKAWLDCGYLEIKGTGFMGKKWDSFVPQPILWKEVYRVLKPGGHLLSFFGTRTYHLGTLAIELAGFEIRDMICWHYGSGFPKSLDISKAFDKDAGAERKVIGSKGTIPNHKGGKFNSVSTDGSHDREESLITEATTDEAKQWQGWGNALKPATEPICVARKPLEGTTIENVRKYGTGGINIDGCRIGAVILRNEKMSYREAKSGEFSGQGTKRFSLGFETVTGRWPANVIFDEHMAVVLDSQTGYLTSGKPSGLKNGKALNCYSDYGSIPVTGYGDTGGASRFFYCAKTSVAERAGAKHPTIKPLMLISYLVRMFTPPGGIVLDPHGGSGTTAEAALENDMRYIVIDNDPDSHAEAEQRINRHHRKYLADLL